MFNTRGPVGCDVWGDGEAPGPSGSPRNSPVGVSETTNVPVTSGSVRGGSRAEPLCPVTTGPLTGDNTVTNEARTAPTAQSPKHPLIYVLPEPVTHTAPEFWFYAVRLKIPDVCFQWDA